MATQEMIFIGVRGTVLALDSSAGTEIWRTALKGADFVNVALVDSGLYATTKGEVFALDRTTGKVLWHNTLKGLGLGLVTVGGSAQVSPAMARRLQQQSDGGAAAA